MKIVVMVVAVIAAAFIGSLVSVGITALLHQEEDEPGCPLCECDRGTKVWECQTLLANCWDDCSTTFNGVLTERRRRVEECEYECAQCESRVEWMEMLWHPAHITPHSEMACKGYACECWQGEERPDERE